MSETELKLLLPGADAARIADQLARHPALRRRARQVQHLHNVYFDVPEQALRRQKVALRVRSQHSGQPPQVRWILTLKTAGTSVGGLSQRGEWEAELPDATPRLSALAHTPWATLDPDGSLWPRLVPAFVTTCTRTLWLVRQRDGSVIEVALDVGDIQAAGVLSPICELELELKAGPPEALHALARRLAEAVAVLPGQASKAERGYALARHEAGLPTDARPPVLLPKMPWAAAIGDVLGEMWDQTLRNSALLTTSDNPDVLHQARVGWRRLRGTLRLLRPWLGKGPDTPGTLALRAFWTHTGTLRELDVMLSETLAHWGPIYTDGDPSRQADWAAVVQAVSSARSDAARAVRARMAEPLTGRGWLDWGQWLLASIAQTKQSAPSNWAGAVAKRLHRQHERLLHQSEKATTDAERHVLRLRAKRLRYGTQAFASVLPPRRVRRWQRDAVRTQVEEGRRRDLRQCVAWLERLAVPAGPLAFMRGVCAGVLSP